MALNQYHCNEFHRRDVCVCACMHVCSTSFAVDIILLTPEKII
jgi:hypothetical protein